MRFYAIIALISATALAFPFTSSGQTFTDRSLSTNDDGAIAARDLAIALLDRLEARGVPITEALHRRALTPPPTPQHAPVPPPTPPQTPPPQAGPPQNPPPPLSNHPNPRPLSMSIRMPPPPGICGPQWQEVIDVASKRDCERMSGEGYYRFLANGSLSRDCENPASSAPGGPGKCHRRRR